MKQAAANGLGTIGPAAHATTNVLAAAIDEGKQDKDVRLACAVALGKIGSGAAGAWPCVKRLLHNSDVGLRCQAVRLTPILAKGNPEADKELLAMLDNEDNVDVLVAAVQEVGELEIKAAVPVLERLAVDTLAAGGSAGGHGGVEEDQGIVGNDECSMICLSEPRP